MRFVYGEPAMVVGMGRDSRLVVSDLHIGMELGLSGKGVHLYNATEKMLSRIKGIMRRLRLKRMIILGDVKESILYPSNAEAGLLRGFFSGLDEFDISIVSGNHDAHLGELINREVSRELVRGGFGFIHGDRGIPAHMLSLDCIVRAHEHVAVRAIDSNGAIHEKKAWAIYKLSSAAKGNGINKNLKLVSMPAFNDLIMGTDVSAPSKRRFNSVSRSRMFLNPEIYDLFGNRISLATPLL